MPEELTTPTAPAASVTPKGTEGAGAEKTPAPSDSPPSAAAAPGTVADTVDLSILDKLDPDTLMKHARVAGILGDRLQKERLRIEAEAETRAEKKAQAAAADAERQRLRDLRRNDPVAYAIEMETKEELEEKTGQLQRLTGETRQHFAKRIGEALGTLEEWKDLTPDDFKAIQEAVVGKEDDEAMGAFVLSAVNLLGTKRTARQMKAELEKVLTKEKEVWRQEWEAERLAGESAPDLRKPNGQPKTKSWTELPPGPEYDKQYEIHVLGRRK